MSFGEGAARGRLGAGRNIVERYGRWTLTIIPVAERTGGLHFFWRVDCDERPVACRHRSSVARAHDEARRWLVWKMDDAEDWAALRKVPGQVYAYSA